MRPAIQHRNSGFSPVSLISALGLTTRRPWSTATLDHEGYYGSLHTNELIIYPLLKGFGNPLDMNILT